MRPTITQCRTTYVQCLYYEMYKWIKKEDRVAVEAPLKSRN